tara:strand:- start:844 stop:1545 length:702 start_codon:yes stop_codon:yes gene_type:complete
MALYKLYSDALEPSVCGNILQSALESPLVGKSPLNAHFAQSRGFAFTAKAAGLTKIKTTYPYLEPALRAIFNPNTQHPTQRWFERPQEPNAFYINVLLLPATAAVGAHIDATLAKPNEVTTLRPKFVSVLYLNSLGEQEGGELELFKGDTNIVQIRPTQGSLLRFAGHIKHGIHAFNPLEPTSVRASIICEHYHFAGTKLASIPDYKKHRRQPFANYLKEAKGRDAQVDVEYG